MTDPRYQQIAQALLDAPDPVTAIAHELADQHQRLDALAARLHAVEARLNRSGTGIVLGGPTDG